MARMDFSQVLNYANGHGGYVLSPLPKTGLIDDVQLECSKKHIWRANAEKLLAGGWCPKCSKAKPRLTLEDMQATAKKRGGQCLADTYKNSVTKIPWRCGRGHVWNADAHSIRKGSWCPQCRIDSMKNTIDDMHVLAKKHGGKCLSKTYVNNVTHLIWQCDRGHKWRAQPANITMGEWCPQCAIDRKRGSIEEMREVAQKKGGRCLSKKYVHNDEKLDWECEKGHRWRATAANVKFKSWCPVCARNQPHTLDDLKAVAAKFGGVCLATSYKNSKTPVPWRCKVGHVFSKSAGHIFNRGQWCPRCRRHKRV